MVARFTYELVNRADSFLVQGMRHACHVMLHAPLKDTLLFYWIPVRHAVMMQMRFDGRLGFPGGFVDKQDRSVEAALQREISEEMGVDRNMFTFNDDDLVCTHLCKEKNLFLHFYRKEIEFDEFLEAERRKEHERFDGMEVLGPVRVPLYNMFDKKGGFPAFTKNNFLGNTMEQLVRGIRHGELLPERRLRDLLQLSDLRDPTAGKHCLSMEEILERTSQSE